MSRGGMYAKMAGVFVSLPSHPPASPASFQALPPNTPHSFLLFAAGGPALMYLVTPAEGELFKRFSPELQKHNLENRERRQREYEDFAAKMKEYSKSNKPIWVAAEEAQEKARQEIIARQREEEMEQRRVRERMREEMKSGR